MARKLPEPLRESLRYNSADGDTQPWPRNQAHHLPLGLRGTVRRSKDVHAIPTKDRPSFGDLAREVAAFSGSFWWASPCGSVSSP